MSHQELLQRIRLGEDSALELKRIELQGRKVTGPSRKDFADELAAFANARGGTVILGVDDKTREALGVPLDDLDTVEKWIRDICNDSVEPALDADIYRLEIEGADGQLLPVIQVNIPQGAAPHKSPGGYLRRIGSSKRKMSSSALGRLVRDRTQVISFDEAVVPHTLPDHLDNALTRRFLRDEFVEEEGVTGDAARRLRLIADDDDGTARLTLSGVLLCTRKPQRWLPHAYIQAVNYAGERTDVDYQTDARDIGGPLDEQVAEALHFVRKNMLVRATKETMRTERPQFSERAVFEALVNAVAHRDYAMAGSRIRMHMFGNRLELYVPGNLMSTLTPDTLHLRQYNRNHLIVSLLARCQAPTGIGRTHLMDRRGDGVSIIRSESERLSGHFPIYDLIGENEIRLVIPAAE